MEPISRHGNQVTVTKCENEDEMLAETEKNIRGWMKEGRETIAVICRDEEEAAMVSARLGEKLPLADSDPETASFTQGIMVLPVEYTKGLEFDGVLLYHPSAEHYPAEDRYVKLLYVAATRALHELTVVHQGDLTDLIAKPVSEEKRCSFWSRRIRCAGKKDADALRRKHLRTVRRTGQCKKACSAAGRTGQCKRPDPQPGRQNSEREPVRCPEERRDAEKPAGQINPSSHRFGEFPDESILRPKGHSCIDCSVRIIKKSKTCIDLTSRYGTLRLTPVEPEVIRVQFLKGPGNAFRDGYWNYRPKTPVNWTAKAGKTLVEVATEKLKLRMDKRNGALQFYDSGGKLLLSEKPELPRQIETGIHPATWTYFDWAKSEKLSARGNLSGDLERMNQKARYISFGGRNLRMPLLVSDCGYGLGIAAEKMSSAARFRLMESTYTQTEANRSTTTFSAAGITATPWSCTEK